MADRFIYLSVVCPSYHHPHPLNSLVCAPFAALPPPLDRSPFPSLNRIHRRVKLHQVSKVTFWHPISFLGGVYLPRYPVYLSSFPLYFLPPTRTKSQYCIPSRFHFFSCCCSRYCRRCLLAFPQVLGIFNSYTNR